MKHALLIAIQYSGETYLKDAKGNLENICNMLVNHKGYDPKSMTICTDVPSGEVGDCVDKKTIVPATEKSIKKEINKTMSKLKSGDVLYFYYTGHGVSIPDTDYDEVDGQDECLFSSDEIPIVDDYLYHDMVLKVPNGARMNAVFDACHSGTILDIPIVFHSGNDNVGPIESSFYALLSSMYSDRKPVPDNVGVTFQMSSCLDHEVSQARSKFLTFGTGFGLFTKHYVNAMKRLDKESKYQDAVQYMYDEAAHITAQHFVVCLSHNIDPSTTYTM